MTWSLALLDPLGERAKAAWCTLERVSRPAYFLTWSWASAWLSSLPEGQRPSLALIQDAGQPTAAFFLGRRTLRRHGVVTSRGAYLNTTGVPRFDELCIEHNGLLGPQACALRALVESLPDDWDELFLPGIDADSFCSLELPPGFRLRVDGQRPAPFVDLDRVRAAGDYLALLSPNSRAQIRRARRRVGPCRLEVARSVGQALAIYDELVALHTARWQERGQPGAFAEPWFDAFHRRLIEQRFADGETLLLRLRSAGGTVGCLYNLVANGRVLFYQSGFAPAPDSAIKPGLLCHAAAVAHAAAAGHAVYDFLAGSDRYKRSLATGSSALSWLRVQRDEPRFAIEGCLQGWKHRLAESWS